MAEDWTPQPLLGFEDLAPTPGGVMPEGEARACIARVKHHWQAFWFELKTFHEAQGWLALGYTSFKKCVEEELGFSERRVYQLLEAAGIRAELAAALEDAPDTEPGFSIDAMTERQARALAPLPPDVRERIARATDFRTTSAPQLRETVQRAQAAMARLEQAEPDWEALADHVGMAGQLQNSKLREAFSRGMDRTFHGLLDIDPQAVIPLLDPGDCVHTELFVRELRQWCDAVDAALLTASTIRIVGR